MNPERRLEQVKELERTLAILETELASENAKTAPDLKHVSFCTKEINKTVRAIDRLKKLDRDRRTQSEKLKDEAGRDDWNAKITRLRAMTPQERAQEYARQLFRVCGEDPDAVENVERLQVILQGILDREEAARREQERLDALPADQRHVEEHRQEGPCSVEGCRGPA